MKVENGGWTRPLDLILFWNRISEKGAGDFLKKLKNEIRKFKVSR